MRDTSCALSIQSCPVLSRERLNCDDDDICRVEVDVEEEEDSLTKWNHIIVITGLLMDRHRERPRDPEDSRNHPRNIIPVEF